MGPLTYYSTSIDVGGVYSRLQGGGCSSGYISSFWFPVENREEPIESVLSVCASVTDYLRNRSEDFSETRHEVGGQKCKKRSTAAFLRFRPVFSKTAHLCEKKPFFAIFCHFWQFLGLCGKSVPRIFLKSS